MKLSHVFFFSAAGLIGICCQKVTELSVKIGSSISIPCLYESQYTDNEKYLCLCKINYLELCRKVIKTDQPSVSEKYSIFDDKLQHVFTVTIRDLTAEDNCYLCRVSKHLRDLKHRLSLDVTTSVPKLYVDQQNITAALGGSVTVMCHYNKKKRFQWCKFGSSCIEQSEEMFGMSVTIDTNLPNVANVTMSGLRQENSGWYFCENDRFQMPVNITILKEVTTAAPTRTPHLTSVTHWSTAWPHTSIFANTANTENTANMENTANTANTGLPINTTTAVTEKGSIQQDHNNSTKVIVIAVGTISVLLLTSTVIGVVAWKIKSRRKIIPDAAEGSQTVKEPDVLYSDVIFAQQSAKEKMHKPHEESVVYSVIVTHDTSQQTTGPAEGSVIYSTVWK